MAGNIISYLFYSETDCKESNEYDEKAIVKKDIQNAASSSIFHQIKIFVGSNNIFGQMNSTPLPNETNLQSKHQINAEIRSIKSLQLSELVKIALEKALTNALIRPKRIAPHQNLVENAYEETTIIKTDSNCPDPLVVESALQECISCTSECNSVVKSPEEKNASENSAHDETCVDSALEIILLNASENSLHEEMYVDSALETTFVNASENSAHEEMYVDSALETTFVNASENSAHEEMYVDSALETTFVNASENSAHEEMYVDSALETTFVNALENSAHEEMCVDSALETTFVNASENSAHEETSVESTLESTLVNAPENSVPDELLEESLINALENSASDEMIVEIVLEEILMKISNCIVIDNPNADERLTSSSSSKSDKLIDESQDLEDIPPKLIRAECSYCHRYFITDRLPVHERICKNAQENKEIRLRNSQPSIAERLAALSSAKRLQLFRKSANVIKRCVQLKEVSTVDVVPEETPSTIVDERIECSFCHRRFCSERIEIHEGICIKINRTKRTPFDSMMKRMSKGFKTFTRIPKKINNTYKRINFKQPNDEINFKNLIEYPSKKVDTNLANFEDTKKASPPTTSRTRRFITCPHCKKTFEGHAGTVHIIKCERKKTVN